MTQAIRLKHSLALFGLAVLISQIIGIVPVLAQINVDEPIIWSRAVENVEGDYQIDDTFGAALASFSELGSSALIIGVPLDDSSAGTDHGSINQLIRFPDGTLFSGPALSQDSPGIPGASESGDQFGRSVAVGDFDCDGAADIAIGTPAETLGASATEAGAVTVVYAPKTGPSPQFWTQDSAGIFGLAEANDGFGGVLAVGDFDINGCDDLAISVLGEAISGLQTTGGVHILFGTNGTGLTSANSQFVSFADTMNAVDGANSGPFGWSLASLGFESQSPHWLIVGMPFYDGTGNDQGAVFAFAYSFSSQQMEWKDTGIGVAEGFLGYSLASADFNGDNNDDLAVGHPGAPLGQGSVSVSQVSGSSLSNLSPSFSYSHSSSVWPGGTLFGATLVAGDFNGDGRMDLAATSNKNGTNPVESAVHVAYQSGPEQSPMFGVGMQLIEESDIPGASGGGLFFGLTMTAADFNSDQSTDLVIFSSPSQVIELPGARPSLFEDGFETGDASNWSSTTN